ncbi:ZIP family metal transporter [Tenacibaculum sp. S7007]|uniref:ZIP family metal transporter n=1 Tax=Tenacibaculum pelagium TaxID=2759527 RepID=A0A839AMG3_9FLAO|nr:ZIP family metal transporter [Tenacibaculum pelagium]MBA6155374.1 ZIP family metal transporter [Tenacibaculum pelagium]
MSYILLIFSVLIGSLLVLVIKPNNKIVRLLLAFSGAYLLSVTILHLLPEVYTHSHEHGAKKIGILILVGIIIQSVLESFSKGAEHGHIHLHSDKSEFPWLLFVSLCFHAFSEGLPIHHANDNLLWAIIVHKIPIAIVLTTFLLKTNYSKQTIILFLGIFSLMSPLGVFISDKVNLFNVYHEEITALIIGVFLHISTIILFESSENHKFNFQKFTAIILGILLTVFTL